MNKVNVRLYVFSDRLKPIFHKGYDEKQIGKVFSNENEIKVNKTISGYTILYTDAIFMQLNETILAKNLIELFVKKLPNCIIDFSVHYSYETDGRYTQYSGNSLFDNEVAKAVLNFSNTINRLTTVDMSNSNFKYSISYSLQNTAKEYYKSLAALENDDDDFEEDEDDDDDIADESPFKFLAEALKSYDDKKSKKDKKKKKVSEKTYGKSKVIQASKNPKKSYHRHGVMTCSNKDAIRKDEKIIKEFLKDFFPGDSNWKREFRKDVLKRWVKMYVVTSKQLKHLEKQYRKERMKKHQSSIDTNKALDFTRRLINSSGDIWNDPTR